MYRHPAYACVERKIDVYTQKIHRKPLTFWRGMLRGSPFRSFPCGDVRANRSFPTYKKFVSGPAASAGQTHDFPKPSPHRGELPPIRVPKPAGFPLAGARHAA